MWTSMTSCMVIAMATDGGVLLQSLGCVMYGSVLLIVNEMIDDLNHLTQDSIETHGLVGMRHCDTGVCLESTRSSNI